MKFETLAIHAGQEPDPNNGAVMTPVYLTSTYMQDGVAKPSRVTGATQPDNYRGDVVKRRAVVFMRVITKNAALKERGEFGGVNGFVVMQRAVVQGRQAQREREHQRQQERQCAPPVHLTGSA